jgi:transposase-like protein
MRPGVSMAAVALEHSLNANMLRKWVIDAEQAGIRAPTLPVAPREVQTPAPTFIPLALSAPPVEGDIRLELQRSGTTVNIVWPAAAAVECAAWLRDWLR